MPVTKLFVIICIDAQNSFTMVLNVQWIPLFNSLFVVISFKAIYSIIKQIIIRFGFCDIRNNQGLGSVHVISLTLLLQLITLTLTLFILDITKTSSDNCL